MNWYEISLIFGIGALLFFSMMFFIAKWLVKKGSIHECKSCGKFMEKEKVEKHIQEVHGN